MAVAGAAAASALGVARAFGRTSQAAPPPLPPLPAIWSSVPRIPLWPGTPPGGGFAAQTLPEGYPEIFVRNVASPELRMFVPARSNGHAVLSIPGGAYTFVSVVNEGIDVARRMTARGYTVFVLVYRLPGEGWAQRADVPLQDAQRAVRLVRSRCARYGLDPASLSVVGFSAGGHLAATLATGFDERVSPRIDAIDAIDARPAHVGLIYPVISHDPGVGHADSSRQLLGPSPDPATIARRSPALHVGPATPPVFLAHALDDPAVPAENSTIMLHAMQAAKRPVEAHFFQRGGHGFGVGTADLPASRWPDLYLDWIEDRGGA
jgi:acetyl esterase/lipase